MRVKGSKHSIDGAVDQVFNRHFFDITALNDCQNVRKNLQFLVCRRLIGSGNRDLPEANQAKAQHQQGKHKGGDLVFQHTLLRNLNAASANRRG